MTATETMMTKTAAPGATGESRTAQMSQGDLSELFEAFNDVTSKLQETHERLTGEVIRLKGELRRANDELERSRRLAALGEMAAGIAHEVRNPLGSIGLYAEMLVADLDGQEAECAIARKIVGAVQGLDAVVNDVLAFSRELRTAPASQSTADAFERAAASCADVLDTVTISISGDEWIEADAALLQQAIVNLIRNACDAMDGQGSLSLATSRTLTDDGDPAILLSVEDTGPGIPPEVRERMFNPFFTTRAAGTGLGLAIVHRIVDAHAGQIRVRNRAAQQGDSGGATVEIILPARPQQAHTETTSQTGTDVADPRSAA